jgi:hypothetical protein
VADQRRIFGVPDCLAVSFNRFSVRIYYIMLVESHRAPVSERLTRFLGSAWGEHFSRLQKAEGDVLRAIVWVCVASCPSV